MPGFRDVFEAYGGNYSQTMARFMNNEKMYLKLLNMFFQDENLDKLGKALKAGKHREAFEAAHTLKGVAANMGLTPFYEKVCVIVEPLRRGEDQIDYMAAYQDLLSELQRVRILHEELKEVYGYDR